jgi:hypothetical protein
MTKVCIINSIEMGNMCRRKKYFNSKTFGSFVRILKLRQSRLLSDYKNPYKYLN